MIIRLLLATLLTGTIASCSKDIFTVKAQREVSTVAIYPHLLSQHNHGLSKAAGRLPETIVSRIWADEFPAITLEHSYRVNESIILDEIPSGENRHIQLWGVSASGDTLHRSEQYTIDLTPGQTETLSAILSPLQSSIDVYLHDVPSYVESVTMTFISDEQPPDTFTVTRARKVRMSISLFPVAVGMQGTLLLTAQNATGEIIHQASTSVSVTGGYTQIQPLQFSSSTADISLSLGIAPSYQHLFYTDFTPAPAEISQTNQVLVREIYYNEDGHEYIVLHAPDQQAASELDLTIAVNGDTLTIPSVDFSNDTAIVIARSDAEGVDFVEPDLNFSNSSANHLAIVNETGEVMDFVFFSVSGNWAGWPSTTNGESLQLSAQFLSAQENDQGSSWVAAEANFTQSP